MKKIKKEINKCKVCGKVIKGVNGKQGESFECTGGEWFHLECLEKGKDD